MSNTIIDRKHNLFVITTNEGGLDESTLMWIRCGNILVPVMKFCATEYFYEELKAYMYHIQKCVHANDDDKAY